MPYRAIYFGLGLLAVAAVALGIALAPEGETVELPGALEAIHPAPGDLVPAQTAIRIDLEVGYEATILVDGWPVTDASFEPATGVYRWAPSPTNPVIQEWSPGEHTVVITWNTYSGLPDTGSFKWTFRVG
jgi:hypothetical protein